jgi:ubiquinone/menaquinone biosynthesis C-methylase UbiE
MFDQIPKAEPNGFVKTLNNMGYMTSTLDPVSSEFVEFSAVQRLPALELGAAYGVATRSALEKGARVIANDIDARHLELMWEHLDAGLRGRLNLLPGDCMRLAIPDQSVSSILICRVLHFFRGERIEGAAALFHRWLARGGRVHVVCETPYLRNFSSFLPLYEARKAAGELWPGFIEDVAAVAPDRAAFLPKEMHLLDPAVLKRVFEKAGFQTVFCDTLARPDFPEDIRLDGRESVGYIGEK